MALQFAFTSNQGFASQTAYHRVVQLELDYSKKRAQVRVFIYKDLEARQNNLHPMGMTEHHLIDQESITLFTDTFGTEPLSATNPLQSTYEYLKAQPEFQGSIDV